MKGTFRVSLTASQADENSHFTWVLTPSSHLQGVARGVENHPLLRLTSLPLPLDINAQAIINMLRIFYLPLPLPPSHGPLDFCALMNSLLIKKL